MSGAAIGSNKKSADIWPTGGLATKTYTGAPVGYWGYGLSAADVRNSSFGVALIAEYTGVIASVARVDYFEVTLTYTAPPLTPRFFWWIIILGWVITQPPALLALALIVAWGTLPRQHTVTRRGLIRRCT